MTPALDKPKVSQEYAALKELALGRTIDPNRVTVTEKRSFLKMAHVRPSQDHISINAGHWQNAPPELKLQTYTHEIAHHKPKADGHKPSFWQAYEEVFYDYWDAKDEVERILGTDIDWHRYVYMCVDDVSSDSVDRRCEEPEERKHAFAEALPYSMDAFETFDRADVGWASGNPFNHDGFGNGPCKVSFSFFSPDDDRHLDFTDDELAAFLRDRELRGDGEYYVVDAPLVNVERDDEGDIQSVQMWSDSEGIRAALYERLMPTTAHIMFGVTATVADSEWGAPRDRIRDLIRRGEPLHSDPELKARRAD